MEQSSAYQSKHGTPSPPLSPISGTASPNPFGNKNKQDLTLLGSSLQDPSSSSQETETITISKETMLRNRRQVDELKGTNLSLSNQINAKDEQILNLKKQITTLKQNIVTLETQIQAHEEEGSDNEFTDDERYRKPTQGGPNEDRQALLHSSIREDNIGSSGCVLFGKQFW